MERSTKPSPAHPIERLLQEARATVRAWRRHHAEDPSGARWTQSQKELLLDLKERGPQTVPQLARYRRVSRQHVQVIANRLIEAGLIVTQPNPAHLRSCLLGLTPAGVDAMAEADEVSLDGVDWGAVDLEQLGVAIETLEKVRGKLESMHRRAPEAAVGSGASDVAGSVPKVHRAAHEAESGGASSRFGERAAPSESHGAGAAFPVELL